MLHPLSSSTSTCKAHITLPRVEYTSVLSVPKAQGSLAHNHTQTHLRMLSMLNTLQRHDQSPWFHVTSGRSCILRSKVWWFTEFCNSHCVSHFAAFFIVAWTKISIVENLVNKHQGGNTMKAQESILLARTVALLQRSPHQSSSATHGQSDQQPLASKGSYPTQSPPRKCTVVLILRVNDPSAGSPTETLLRLHLPLNNWVCTSSPQHCLRRDSARVQGTHQIIQSVGATGGVYKGQGRNQHKLMTCTY